MKIAVTSQNFKSVTGHAGKSRRFIVFNVGVPCDSPEVVWLDLPLDMSIHEFSGDAHPLDDMDVILTASAGQGFVTKLAQRGVQVITCGESDPRKAVRDYLTGELQAANPHAHLEQERHGQIAGSCGCRCGS
jgi:predicted Fe-Mo cluster-binding NifX family protein